MTSVKEHLLRNEEDIKRILSIVLSKTTAELYASGDYELSSSEERLLEDLVSKRSQGYPFAYISGEKGFYEDVFRVNENVLIPRPETEMLIEISKKLFTQNTNKIKILDLGTGSGVIAITLAKIFPNADIFASDISKKALDIAKLNELEIIKNQRIHFIKSSWFEDIDENNFDLIVSNPPYIEEGDMHLDDLKFEPVNALVSGKDGLTDIRKISCSANDYLRNNGYLIFEHGYNQANSVYKILSKKYREIRQFKDLNNNDRVTLAQRKID